METCSQQQQCYPSVPDHHHDDSPAAPPRHQLCVRIPAEADANSVDVFENTPVTVSTPRTPRPGDYRKSVSTQILPPIAVPPPTAPPKVLPVPKPPPPLPGGNGNYAAISTPEIGSLPQTTLVNPQSKYPPPTPKSAAVQPTRAKCTMPKHPVGKGPPPEVQRFDRVLETVREQPNGLAIANLCRHIVTGQWKPSIDNLQCIANMRSNALQALQPASSGVVGSPVAPQLRPPPPPHSW